MKEEELEFISVNHDEDDGAMNNAFADPNATEGGGDSVIGSWMFKQSKVCLLNF